MENNALLEVLPIGRENAMHQKEIAERLGTKARRVKELVQQARKQGHQICSGSEGYWIAKNDAEMQRFLQSMRKQAIQRFETTKAMNNRMNDFEGQISLSDTFSDNSREVQRGGTKKA